MSAEAPFTVHRFEIPFENFGEPIYLLPVGDIHRFAHNHAERQYLELLEWIKARIKEGKRLYLLGMGDEDDLMSAHERSSLRAADFHDTTIKTIDDLAKKHVYEFAREWEPLKGHIIGMLEGNHHYRFDSGVTSTQLICEHLNCKYLGFVAFIRLTFKYLKGGRAYSLDIFASHGKSAGKTLSSSVNSVQQMEQIADADIYLCLDEDTQILSLDGWKSIGEIKKGDRVYSFKDGEIFKDIASNVFVESINGNMYQFKNNYLDMFLSADHKILYRCKNKRTKQWGEWLKKRAADFNGYQAQVQFPVSGILKDGSGVDLSDAELSLVGWIISEGHFRDKDSKPGPGIDIIQKNEKKCQIINDLLLSLNYDFSCWVRCDGVTHFHIKKKSADKVRTFLTEKQIPDWVFELSHKQFDVLLKALVMGDGTYKNGNCGTYYSIHEKLIDRLQRALVLFGYRSIKKYRKRGFKDGSYELSYCKRQTVDHAFSRRQSMPINYCGKIWCITTSNGSLIARRNGRTFITGNSAHDHRKWTAMKNRMHLKGGNGSLHLRNKKILLARTGSFQLGYMQDRANYASSNLMAPTDIGIVKIELTPRQHSWNNHQYEEGYIDIHASI